MALCRLWLVVLMMMMLKDEAASVKIITVPVTTGRSLVLSPDHLEGVEDGWDFRWTHAHLVLHNLTTVCPHGRCERLKNGSIHFSRVQPEDSGNYTLDVFDQQGKWKAGARFLLQVDDSSGKWPAKFLALLLLLPLISIIIIFIQRRMKMQRMVITAQKENNVYVEMQSRRSNKEKQKEEESVYVPCHPAVKEDDVYV
ncbi:uncharacterized protein LOC112142862 isoform X2 [Oryzias melastigma]|uniref:uncharacterized protein LOC112142862 isoform X2 n=1 Tax=Oryzias melastigma TaxID=30732 RepID=UPI00168D410D|nr:uncharacterized protein LOC112142862 isoform X2 [Oryzias melastigma]